MAKGFKAQHFEDYSIVKGNVKVKLNLKQYGEKLQKAQHDLDGQIMNDMKPYMPYQAGTFKQQTVARSTALQGTGKVCAGAPPMGRFLYGGKVMEGKISKSPWAMEDAVFIGNELKSARFKDTVHQVCMSHAKNKFVKASNQGGEPTAQKIQCLKASMLLQKVINSLLKLVHLFPPLYWILQVL